MIQKFKRHKIKLLVVGALLVTIFSVATWANSDNAGVVEIHATPLPQATVAYKEYVSGNVSFRYPGIYTIHQTAVKGTNGTYAQASFKADTTYEKHISLQVDDLPGGTLTNSSANNLRQNSPDEYTSRNFTVDGLQAIVWVKKDGTEQTVLVPRGNQVVTMSFVQIGSQNDMTPEVNALLTTLKWKG
jgi:hypothetical protein